jgi:hypothetical protein
MLIRKTNRATIIFALLSGENTLYIFYSLFSFLAIFLGLACYGWAWWRLCCIPRVLSWPGTDEAGLARLLTCMKMHRYSHNFAEYSAKRC